MVYWPKPLDTVPFGSYIRERFVQGSLIDGYLDNSHFSAARKEYRCYSPQTRTVPYHFNTLTRRGTVPHRFNAMACRVPLV